VGAQSTYKPRTNQDETMAKIFAIDDLSSSLLRVNILEGGFDE
jgi:hypothetical protein